MDLDWEEEGTVAEGWIDRAISFWEDNMNALDKR